MRACPLCPSGDSFLPAGWKSSCLAWHPTPLVICFPCHALGLLATVCTMCHAFFGIGQRTSVACMHPYWTVFHLSGCQSSYRKSLTQCPLHCASESPLGLWKHILLALAPEFPVLCCGLLKVCICNDSPGSICAAGLETHLGRHCVHDPPGQGPGVLFLATTGGFSPPKSITVHLHPHFSLASVIVCGSLWDASEFLYIWVPSVGNSLGINIYCLRMDLMKKICYFRI